MALHSFPFIFLFLPLVVVLYRAADAWVSRSAAMWFLLAASIAFYADSAFSALPFIGGSMIFNWFVAQAIARESPRRSRTWLTAGIAANVIFLCYFKYGYMAAGAGSPAVQTMGTVGLPLGISFFTIQQIMYLVDTYERLCAPNSLLDHALFVSFFPSISAGPITRSRQLVKQFHLPKAANGAEDLAMGALRFSTGLFKKVVFADTLGRMADVGFAAPQSLGLVDGWLFWFLYTLQMYFDFSGYSDMAIGVSRMLGITIPENFNDPLRAKTISEFWQRWHMTLTNFITTYLYTPIVRSFGRVTLAGSAFAVFCAMTIAGVWHGSGLTYLVFGAWHGLALAVHQYWRSKKRKLPDWAGWSITFVTVTLGLMVFRCENLSAVGRMLGALAGIHGVAGTGTITQAIVGTGHSLHLAIVMAAAFFAFFGPTSTQFATRSRLTTRLAFNVALMLVVSFLFLNSIPSKDFLYVAF